MRGVEVKFLSESGGDIGEKGKGSEGLLSASSVWVFASWGIGSGLLMVESEPVEKLEPVEVLVEPSSEGGVIGEKGSENRSSDCVDFG